MQGSPQVRIEPDPVRPRPALTGRHDLRDYLVACCPDWRGPTLAIEAHSLEVLHANRHGLEMLQRGYPAHLAGGRLAINAPHATQRLGATLTRLIAELRRNAMLVVDDEDARAAFALRIAVPALPPGFGPGIIAIVDFAMAAVDPEPGVLRAIAEAFDLTGAEGTVLGHLAAGLSLREISVLRGVRIETVRHQCKTVLSKMRCRRQADLVRMVAGLCQREAIGLAGVGHVEAS